MMLLTTDNRPIKKIIVLNDQPVARDEMAENIEYAGLEPVIQTSCLKSLDECLTTITTKADAAILEHHLKSGHYANFSGAEAVARLSRQHFPSLLVTAWANADIDNIRPFRRYIPVLMSHQDANPETITLGLKQCLNEFEKQYAPNRWPWRTLVRIEEVRHSEKSMVYAVIPGWDPDEVVRFPLSIFPAELEQRVVPGRRFFAHVNIGAAHPDELYFEDFELIEKPRGRYAKFLRA
jgi:CheY-like chemotaxis protein